jgi:putative transposase
VKVVQAYRFALDPAPAEERLLRSHAGAARFAWNWGLAKCKERYAAERKWYSAVDLHKLWNAEKKADPVCPGGRRTPSALTRRLSATSTGRCGTTTLLTGVDDRGRLIAVTGPRPLRVGLRKLRRASRAYSRKREGSAGRRKSTARLARINARVASVRADALCKATTALAARYESVVVEDLSVAGMIANRRLARAVADQGFGAARRMLGYKTAREGGTLVVADRWYPSSKKCSGCGSVKAKLSLAERICQCDTCGLVMDRDVNAARNLLSLAASGADSLNACGAAVRPGLTAGRAALKQEPGAANAGQTGTAAHQAAAA